MECDNPEHDIEKAMKCDCHGCNAIIDDIRDMVNQKHYSKKPDFAICIPEMEHIEQFIHCSKCMKELPDNISPQEWARHEVGWTIWGFQVWCVRHNVNVLHVDFQGAKHPSSMERLPETDEEKRNKAKRTAKEHMDWRKDNR